MELNHNINRQTSCRIIITVDVREEHLACRRRKTRIDSFEVFEV